VSRSVAYLWIALFLLAAGALGVCGAHYLDARSRAGAEALALKTVSGESSELARLRASAPAWALRGRPASGLAPRVSAALSACGLPATAMASLSPEAESAVGGGGTGDVTARRTRAVMTLAPVTLPQLGNFLEAWRSREPEWGVASIDLSPQSGREGAAGGGGDLPLRAVIGVEGVFVDQSGGRP
jgi:hypothetical protein